MTDTTESVTDAAGDDNKVPDEVAASLKAPSLDNEIKTFVHQVDGLANTLPLTMLLLSVETKKAKEKLETTYNAKDLTDDDGNIYIQYSGINEDNASAFRALRKRHEKSSLALRVVPQSYLVSLISQYDAFIGNIIRVFYQLRPELLNASGEQFTLAALLEAGSIEAVREAVIDKHVYVTMKGSHEEQIKALSEMSNIDLKKELVKPWKKFIEITERRNLFVHTGGVISNQGVRQELDYLPHCTFRSDRNIVIGERD